MSGYDRTQMWKQWYGAAQTSMSASDQELTHTSVSQSPTRQFNSEKVVLPEERCWRAAPCGHGWVPHHPAQLGVRGG
jgi:hypothetical protein